MLISAAFLLGALFWVWTALPIEGRLPVVVACFGLFFAAVALWLVGLASACPADFAGAASVAILAVVLLRSVFASAYLVPVYRTDSIAYSHEGARLVLEGRNPYGVDMRASLERFGVPSEFTTPLADGDVVRRTTYPALNFLAHVPFLMLGGRDLRYSVLLFQILTLWLVHHATPRSWRPWTLVSLVADPSLADLTAAGVTDFVWVFWVCAAVRMWRRPTIAALLMGLACATKQPPWLVMPYLVLRVFLEPPGASVVERATRAARFAAVAGVTFVSVNLPFIVADAGAWRRAVLANVDLPMIPFGEGLSLLTQHGLGEIRTSSHFILVLASAAALGAGYALWFPASRNALWMFPPVVLWFSHRAFHNYFVFWLVPSVLALAEESRSSTPASGPPRVGKWRNPASAVVMLSWSLLVTAVVSRDLASAPTDVTVQVIEIRNRPCQGWICSMRLAVRNDRAADIEPSFRVQHANWQALGWQIVDGPRQLAAGSSAVYEITTAERGAMVPPGTDLRVEVRDARSSHAVVARSSDLTWEAISEAAQLYQSGVAALREGDIDRSIASLERAIMLQPGSTATGLALADAYERGGRAHDAEERRRQAGALDSAALTTARDVQAPPGPGN